MMLEVRHGHLRSGPPRLSGRRRPVVLAVFIVAMVIVVSVTLTGCGQGSTSGAVGTEVAHVEEVNLPQPATPHVPQEVVVREGVEAAPMPDSAAVYRLTSTTAVTREAMDSLADKLGIGQDRHYTAQGLSGSNWSLSFPRSDNARCFSAHLSAWLEEATETMVAGNAPEPVSLEEARVVADELLTTLGLNAGLEFSDAGICDSIGTCTPGGQEVLYPITMSVAYTTRISGLRLVGPGAAVSITVGPKGQLVGCVHSPGEAEPNLTERVELRPVEVALDDVRTGDGAPPPELDKERATQVVVEDVELAYYAPPAGEEDGCYKPVYVFHVEMADGTRGEWIVSAFDGPKSAEEL